MKVFQKLINPSGGYSLEYSDEWPHVWLPIAHKETNRVDADVEDISAGSQTCGHCQCHVVERLHQIISLSPLPHV
jgi:uncharacterized 2Fe-2S/4Fe-4S cluster protein (DUF4445 family)